MRVALDSNVLLYSAGVVKAATDRAKVALIRPMLANLVPREEVVCPWQTFGEAYYVMHRYGLTRDACREILSLWRTRYTVIASSEAAFVDAVELATDHRLQFWDALILSVAARNDCQLLLSEDMQAGFQWRGVTVVDPFAAALDQRLLRVLESPQ